MFIISYAKTWMNKLKKSELGFGTVELILLLIIVILVGLVGWYIWNNGATHNKIQNSNPTIVTSPIASNEQVDPYAGWKTYTSNLGEFTFKYPEDWDLSGFRESIPYFGDDLNGDENPIRLTKPTSADLKVDNFGINMQIQDESFTGTPFDIYPNGTTEELSNNIILWLEKENVNYATGAAKTTCPTIRVGKDKSFSIKLTNGKYLIIEGSFCWGQGLSTSQNYSQQIKSSEWSNAIDIIKSVTF